ncbi:MAG: C_GCAxxG_C_C family protein [Clostridia bacterium]|nr:C_GCAxxG_C_C family protein [Clostridia bacterium]
MTKGELASLNFSTGMNCAQAVLLAFSEEIGLSKETLLKLSLPFGGGMGRLRLTCGAVTGMVMAYGLIKGIGTTPTHDEKMDNYKGVVYLTDEFKKLNRGTIICAELLGLKEPEGTYVPEERTEEYYKKRPCGELCSIAAEILDKYLKEN